MSLHPIKSAAHAEKYFEHDGGYYTADRQADGSVRDSRWGGEIARRAGMDGQAVQAAEFALALNGVGPGADPSKPVGSAGGRGGPEARRSGWDFNISAPKSISMAALFDKQVVEIFDKANAAACRVLEREADCRVTQNGSTKVERTGALLIAQFTHWNTRTNDVSLHTHNIVMNMTTGPDGKYRALESKRMHKAQAEARTTFYQVLGKGLERAGYEMRWVRDRTGRAYPEVASVTRAQVRAFSKRQAQIHAARERLQAKDPSLNDKYLDKAAYHAGRDSKQHINLEEQKERWRQDVLDAGITFSRTTEMQQQIKNGAQHLARETQLPQHIKRIGESLRNDAEAAISYEHFRAGKPATPRMVAAVEKVAAEKGVTLPKDHTDLGVARHFLNTHGKRSLPMIAEPRGGLRLVPDSESVDRADDSAQRHELAQAPSVLIGERDVSDAQIQAQDLEAHQARDLDEFARTQPDAPSTEQVEGANQGRAAGSAAPEQEQGARADGQDQTRSQEHGGDAERAAAGDKGNPKADDWDKLTHRLEQVGVLGFERDVGRIGKLPATETRLAQLRAIEAGKDFAARSAARAERLQLERFMATHEGRLVEIRGRLHAAGSPRTIGNFAVSTLTAARGERQSAVLLTRGDRVLGAADHVSSDPGRQLGEAMRELGVHHFDDRVGQVGDLKATETRLAQLRAIEANQADADGRRKYSAEQVDRAVTERAAVEMFMKRNEGRLIEVDGRLHAFEKAERLAAGFTSAMLIAQRDDGKRSPGHVVARDGYVIGTASRIDVGQALQHRYSMQQLKKVETDKRGVMTITRANGDVLRGRVGENQRSLASGVQVAVLRDTQTDRVIGSVIIDHRRGTATFAQGQRLLRDERQAAFEKAAEKRERDGKSRYFTKGMRMYRRGWFGRVHRIGLAEQAQVMAARAVVAGVRASTVLMFMAAKGLTLMAANAIADKKGWARNSAWRLNAPLSKLREQLLEGRGYSREEIRISLMQDRLMQRALKPAQYKEYLREKYAGEIEGRIQGAMAKLDERSAWRDAAGKIVDEISKSIAQSIDREQDREQDRARREDRKDGRADERGRDQGDQPQPKREGAPERDEQRRDERGQDRTRGEERQAEPARPDGHADERGRDQGGQQQGRQREGAPDRDDQRRDERGQDRTRGEERQAEPARPDGRADERGRDQGDQPPPKREGAPERDEQRRDERGQDRTRGEDLQAEPARPDGHADERGRDQGGQQQGRPREGAPDRDERRREDRGQDRTRGEERQAEPDRKDDQRRDERVREGDQQQGRQREGAPERDERRRDERGQDRTRGADRQAERDRKGEQRRDERGRDQRDQPQPKREGAPEHDEQRRGSHGQDRARGDDRQAEPARPDGRADERDREGDHHQGRQREGAPDRAQGQQQKRPEGLDRDAETGFKEARERTSGGMEKMQREYDRLRGDMRDRKREHGQVSPQEARQAAVAALRARAEELRRDLEQRQGGRRLDLREVGRKLVERAQKDAAARERDQQQKAQPQKQQAQKPQPQRQLERQADRSR